MTMKFYSILLTSLESTQSEKHENPVVLLPVLVRLGLFLVVPMVELAFHKLAHIGIHLSIERLAWLKAIEHKWKHLPDVLMLGALVVLHFVSE